MDFYQDFKLSRHGTVLECEDVHEISVVAMGDEQCSPAAYVHVVSEGVCEVR